MAKKKKVAGGGTNSGSVGLADPIVKILKGPDASKAKKKTAKKTAKAKKPDDEPLETAGSTGTFARDQKPLPVHRSEIQERVNAEKQQESERS